MRRYLTWREDRRVGVSVLQCNVCHLPSGLLVRSPQSFLSSPKVGKEKDYKIKMST